MEGGHWTGQHNKDRVYPRRESKRRRIGNGSIEKPAKRINPSLRHRIVLEPPRPTSKELLEEYGFVFNRNNYKLGSGHYSKVVHGYHQGYRRQFAIKVVDLQDVGRAFRTKFLPREINCWRRLNHPNCCRLLDDFEQFNYHCFVMELADQGDLLSYVQANGPIGESRSKRWMQQLLAAVNYLHSQSMAHRDLKLENLLLFRGDVVKLADFGFAKQGYYMSETWCGSKAYCAPEILTGDVYDPFKADVWSLGVIAFIFVTCRMPFKEDVGSNWVIVESQRNRAYFYPAQLSISHACRHSIDMMSFDARRRPNAHQCRFLPWFFCNSDPPNARNRTAVG